MIQLNPQENFLIARQLEDVLDETPYYLKAIIRDNNGDIIDEVKLDNVGNNLFIKNWRTPADPTGLGRYITISIYVYEDEDYTILSQNYGVRTDTYLIHQREGKTFVGSDISYNKIKEIVKEEIEKISIPDNSDLIKEIRNLNKSLNDKVESLNIKKDLLKIAKTFENLIKDIDKSREIISKLDDLRGRKEKDYTYILSEIKNNQVILSKTFDNLMGYLNGVNKQKEIELNRGLNILNELISKISLIIKEKDELENYVNQIKLVLENKDIPKVKSLNFKNILNNE